MSKISNSPLKGMADWLPEEYRIRKYIFDTWRKICLSYGFEEYLTPILENADIYRAKSGEDIGQKELMIFVDAGGRELAIRPEMTPSVTRLVSRVYDSAPKPIKYFSLANFVRNEKPQRGRNREFWQLNADIFGSTDLGADLEILQLSLDILLAFNPPAGSFKLLLNHRQLLNGLLESAKVKTNLKVQTVRILDKFRKLSASDFMKALADLGLKNSSVDYLIKFMTSANIGEVKQRLPELADNAGLKDIEKIISELDALGYGRFAEFDPAIIRGFDYYDGLIFEFFDKHPDNNRAMFGGGRYNGLAQIFGKASFPAVGIAPGDETIKLFLESWGLLDNIKSSEIEKYYLPLLAPELIHDTRRLAKKLRSKNVAVELGFEVVKLGKALEYANKKKIAKVVILGTEEKNRRVYKIKDMLSGSEKEQSL